ncbi:MAG: penicillin-binding protein 2 [Helicobacteraceae bacterium]|nr:penicillin-binding protein 2 [Helicobacteraceae bacterium]
MEKTGKILAIFLLIVLFFAIFFAAALNAIRKGAYERSYYRNETISAIRGAIVTGDNLTLAVGRRSYSAAFDGRYAEDKELIADLSAIFLRKTKKQVMDLLNKNVRIYLARDLSTQEARNLAHLSRELDRRGAFKSFNQNGMWMRYGFEIAENDSSARLYPYGDLAQPILGFVQRVTGDGQIGLERYYDMRFNTEKNGALRALRDAGGNLIYSNAMNLAKPRHGVSLLLSLNGRLQSDLERVVDEARMLNDAQEVIAAVMESESGRILAFASSARFNAANITPESLRNAKINAIQYAFEPGSVMKPFIVALLFEDGLVGQFDLVRTYNGKFKLGQEIITDLVPKEWMSVEDVVVNSSNIGTAQLAMKLNPYKINDGLSGFGFARESGIDLPYESAGYSPGLNGYRSDVYRATAGYGYGIKTTFIQLLKAYNVFNNGGIIVTPRLIDAVFGENAPAMESAESVRVISLNTSQKMLQILRKTVVKGGAKQAMIDGIFTAGKTGTAHIARGGVYLNDYHNSFFGFANDDMSRYTIGALVIDPKNRHYASQTAAPIFKDAVLLLEKYGLIKSAAVN